MNAQLGEGVVEIINWRALRAEGLAHAEKQIDAAAAKDSVSLDFYGAALVAMRSAHQDGALSGHW